MGSAILAMETGLNTLKILVIGGGGREHAIAWRLHRADSRPEIVAVPGNPGIAQIGTCVPTPATVEGYCDLATQLAADYTIVGPEAPLVAGIVDHFRRRGLPIVGPTQAAARLEGSKLYAKALFERAAIPTARRYASLADCDYPVVVKADGLAAGKGVVIARNRAEAAAAMERFGNAVLLEECLEGEEISYIWLTDGARAVPFAPAQDHKRIFDGDQGPNTGGMGAYCDTRLLSTPDEQHILERIIEPTLRQMTAEGTPFTGFLYAGLMMTSDGPKVLEFNARLGDPETQALMMSLKGDFADILHRAALGQVKEDELTFGDPSVCVVLAAAGYPEQPVTGDEISGLDELPAEVVAFHAGTASHQGRIVTNGGRVLGITAQAETLERAIFKAYAGVDAVHFKGMQYRRDIGQKGLRRW